VIYAKGGVYTDIDTTALKPISRWIPKRVYPPSVDLVVGVEVDEPEASDEEVARWTWGSRFQLCQWTFMARARHPVLARMVEWVVDRINQLAADEVTPGAKLRRLTRQEVLETTGPVAWTQVIHAYLSNITETNVDWRNMTALRGPKVIGDALILPVTAFAPDQKHSGSRGSHDKLALSKHHLRASQWPESGRSTWHDLLGYIV